jgi:maleylacetoacetate isomerase
MKLYSYFRSSAAYRVRIALNFKGLAYETVPVHLVKDGGHNRRPEFRAVNPQMRIPALVAPTGEVLIQSLAIIEYLEETQPDPPLLPKDPIARAKVRALADIIACDIHPLNNGRCLPRAAGRQRPAAEGSAREVPEDRRYRIRLPQASRLRPRPAGKPAGCGVIEPYSHFRHHCIA